MIIFRFADNLSLRVGRRGVWIYAPEISAVPIHLDTRILRDSGLPILAGGSAEESARPEDPSRHPGNPLRTS